MRTFEEIRGYLLKENQRFLRGHEMKLAEGNLNDFDRQIEQRIIANTKTAVENIDEVAMIEIGGAAKTLVSQVKNAVMSNPVDFYRNPTLFLDSKVRGIREDGSPMRGQYWGQQQCMQLGINTKELYDIFGKDPLSANTEANFINYVNTQFGTQVPTEAELRHAEERYKEARKSGNESLIAEATVNMLECARNAGRTRNGGIYYPLAQNETYLSAKQIMSGRSL